MTRRTGPFPLFLQRFPVVLLVCAGALLAAWWFSATLEPVYRSQARGFEPATAESFSLESDTANLPAGAKLPSGNSERQASLLGLMKTAEMRVRIANRVEGVTAVELEDRVDVDVDAYNMLVVTAYDGDPRRAAEVANTYLEVLQEELQRTTRRDLGRRQVVLEASLDDAEAALAAAEQERLDYLQATGSVDYEAELLAASSRVQELREKLAQLEVRGATLADERAELVAQRDARPEFIPSSRTEARNPRLDQLRNELAKEEAALAAMLARQKPDYPPVKAQQQRLDQILSLIALEEEVIESSRSFDADPLRQTYEQRLVDLELEEANLAVQRAARQEQLDAALAEWRALPGFRSGLRQFDDEIARQRALAETLRLQLAEARLAMDGDPAFIEVVERAQEPAEPYFPNLLLNLAIALLAGVLLSALMIVMFERAARWREEAPW